MRATRWRLRHAIVAVYLCSNLQQNSVDGWDLRDVLDAEAPKLDRMARFSVRFGLFGGTRRLLVVLAVLRSGVRAPLSPPKISTNLGTKSALDPLSGALLLPLIPPLQQNLQQNTSRTIPE
jgi:hypothetical protein